MSPHEIPVERLGMGVCGSEFGVQYEGFRTEGRPGFMIEGSEVGV